MTLEELRADPVKNPVVSWCYNCDAPLKKFDDQGHDFYNNDYCGRCFGFITRRELKA